jgi:hypothetical protein
VSDRYKFSENRFSDSHNLRKGVNNFLSKFSYFLTDLGEIWYRSPRNFVEHYDLRKYRSRESHTLTKGATFFPIFYIFSDVD